MELWNSLLILNPYVENNKMIMSGPCDLWNIQIATVESEEDGLMLCPSWQHVVINSVTMFTPGLYYGMRNLE